MTWKMTNKSKNVAMVVGVIAVLAVAAILLGAVKLPFQAYPTSSCTAAQKNFVDCNAYYSDKRVQCNVLSGSATGTWYHYDNCPSGQVCDDTSTASVKPCKSISTPSNCPDQHCDGNVWFGQLSPNGVFAFNIGGQSCKYVRVVESCTASQTCNDATGCSSTVPSCPQSSCQTNYNNKAGAWVYSNPTTSGLSVPVNGQICYYSQASSCGSNPCDLSGQSCSVPLCTVGSFKNSPTCNAGSNAVFDDKCVQSGSSLAWVSTLKQQCSSTQTCTFATCVNNAPNPYCGDGACSNSETCSSCSQDCGSCAPTTFCGNGVCDGGDTCDNCANDCGACPVQPPVVNGCTDVTASNYNPQATVNDGSCYHPQCTANSDCDQGCFGAVCTSGMCISNTGVPSPPCSGATWTNCAWDSSTCTTPPSPDLSQITKYAPYILVIILVAAIAAVVMRRRK